MSELILGIESTCDETGVALVRGTELVADVVASSMDEHARFGGIVPEVASRAHLEAFIPTLDEAVSRSGHSLADVDAIAVAAGPGLVGSLTVGVAAAKALALALGRPLYGVNHVVGHAAVDELVHGEMPPRSMALVVSGGHTSLLLVDDIATDVTELGHTLDDAAGEAFDKGARLLGLGYPGGPAIQKAAAEGSREAIPLPRAWLDDTLDFSFSGLKTSLLRHVQPWRLPDPPRELPPGTVFPPHQPPVFRDDFPVADFAASFEEAIVDVLATKAVWALERTGARSLVIAGGVAANRALRERLRSQVADRFGPEGPTVSWPDLSFCTDNAAMVAGLAAHRPAVEGDAAWALDACPNLAFGQRRC